MTPREYLTDAVLCLAIWGVILTLYTVVFS